MQVGRLGQRARAPADDGDQRDREPARVEDEVAQLVGLAGVGQRQHRVLRRDHAEIAVAGLGRMDVERRRAGRGQGGGDLARDVAALAHAADDDASGHAGQQLDDGGERAVDRRGQRCSASASARTTRRPLRDRRIRASFAPAWRAAGWRRSWLPWFNAFRLAGRSWPAAACRSAPAEVARVRAPSQRQRVASVPVVAGGRGHSVREDVLVRPARQVELRPRTAGNRSRPAANGCAPFACEHRVEARPQRMQMEHVAGRVAQLRLGQLARTPVRTLLAPCPARCPAPRARDPSGRAGRCRCATSREAIFVQ